ncbi:MAG TPA: acetyl-CoA hydrolase/transferase C-terminal domain-containing protein [Actinomycetospora sp.]|nr:acetyl-CoA hydrolase/transferase C-terminal domain-containing protein [Actinomycetospora sp.]
MTPGPPLASLADMVAAARRPADAVLDHVGPGAQIVVNSFNGEPATVLDALEAGGDRLSDVRVHQMLAPRPRPSIQGEVPGLRHVSWFLSPATREAFRAGHCDLVPNNFSDVPRLLRRSVRPDLVVASVSAPDRHGYFSLGTDAGYTAAFIGEVPFFVEVNAQMPRTYGANQLHVSDVVGWCEADRPLVVPASPAVTARDRTIASLVAERIPDGATLQIGIGAVPDMVLAGLGEHRDLGVHTEVFGSGWVDLVEAGVVTGTRKATHRGKIVTTASLGDQRLYDFVADNPGVEFHPVDYTNDPWNIAREPLFRAVNATLEVDFLGQCASETLGSQYVSSSGGQPDYARGAIMSEHGAAFIVLHSATHDDTVSRIVPQLQPGAAVTTFKNIVDNVVTEYGVAELRGATVAERTSRLIAIAHPRFRDDLTAQARSLGYL